MNFCRCDNTPTPPMTQFWTKAALDICFWTCNGNTRRICVDFTGWDVFA
jgi:hypothetical protein